MKKAALLLLLIALGPLVVFLVVMRVRFLVDGNVLTRIGHTALTPDLYVKTGLLGWRPRYRGILLASPRMTVNSCLLQHWSAFITIVTHPLLIALLRPLERISCLQYAVGAPTLPDGTKAKIVPAVYAIQRRYEAVSQGRALLRLSEAELERGTRRLEALGVPPDAWFACLHVRESGYLPQRVYHSFRNADVLSYLLAVEAIVARGGWAIRIGDSSMKPLPRIERVVDYVHSGLQTDWMDVFCLGRCRLFLGDTSGPFVVSFTFGVPCAIANQIPMGHGAYSSRDLWIPKRYRLVQEDRDLTFAEVLRSPLRALGRTEGYEATGIRWVDNTPEEIRDLAVEMMDRLDGRFASSQEDERLQQVFHSLLAREPMYETTARGGRDFLRQYAHLLPREATGLSIDQAHDTEVAVGSPALHTRSPR